MTPHDPLNQLCARLGIQRAYTDGLGQHREASADALLAVLGAMGHDLRTPDDASAAIERLDNEQSSRLLDPVHTHWLESPSPIALRRAALTSSPINMAVNCEDGTRFEYTVTRDALVDLDELSLGLPITDPLPMGFHELSVAQGSSRHTARIIAAPTRCWSPDSATTDVALFLPLHALRTERNLGVGSYDELGVLAGYAHNRSCDTFGTLPLLSTFLDEPFEPSPYAPVSRSIFGELFIDPHAAAERHTMPTLARLLAEKPFQNEANTARSRDLVSYRETWGLVRRCLEAAAKDIRASDTLRDEVERYAAGDPLMDAYAEFRVTILRQRRDPDTSPDAERWMFLCAQWLADAQLRALSIATDTSGLYLDLPVGADGGGFDARRRPDLYARGVSLGAPPDALFTKGQTWGFPPQIPSRMRALGHAELIEAVDRHGRYADALRIDHAAGLHRCFWVPNGFDATDGVYVRTPREEQFAVLSVLSHRHRVRLIGENLGTIPPEVNEGISEHNVLGMRIAQFELGDEHHPLPTKSDQSLVALNTHDMPTFHAFWTGADIELNTRLGVFSLDFADEETDSRDKKRERVLATLVDRGLVDNEDPNLRDILEAVLADLASKQPDVLAINLEDLWLETDPQNIPGTVAEYPNWRRKAARTLNEITSDPALAELIDRVVSATRTPDG
ncbi:MAG: 4-alpha-glucanotransferase [Phycisphaerales bacterium]